MGIIYNPGESNSVALIEKMQQAAKQQELKLVLAAANTTADVVQATHSLINKVSAIFINNDNTALSAFDSIVKISNQHKVPVFCSDIAMIEKGALAAVGPDQYGLGRQTGKLLLQVLQGKNPGEIPVAFPEHIKTKINPAQAKILKIKIEGSHE